MSDRKRRSLAWLAVLVALGAGVGCGLRADRSSPASGKTTETVPSQPLVMDTSQSEYLWDIESHGNKLARTTYGLKALGNALSRADKKALDNFLAGNFQGEVLGK